MKTKCFTNARRIAFPLFILAFFISFVSCKKELDATKSDNNNQEKSVSSAFKDIHFNPNFSKNLYKETPGVAINKNNDVIQVYHDAVSGGLFYNAGTMNDNGQISWNNKDGIKYESKWNAGGPTVAINDNKVIVEMNYLNLNDAHHSNTAMNYRIGHLSEDNKTINFGQCYQFDASFISKVALNNDNTVVVTYQNSPDKLWYRVGVVDPNSNSISWGTAYQYSDNGNISSVAINNNNQVVEAHWKHNPNGKWNISGTLWTTIGTLNPDTKTINWNESTFLKDGYGPDVTLLDNGYLILLHKNDDIVTDLWSMVGEIRGDKIFWFRQKNKFGIGMRPRISANDKNFIIGYDDTEIEVINDSPVIYKIKIRSGQIY
ncbi:MAG: hypothetical protein ACEPOV_12770 [Hyphomicrobiales bacterium]